MTFCSVKPAVFDLILAIAIAMYLGAIHLISMVSHLSNIEYTLNSYRIYVYIPKAQWMDFAVNPFHLIKHTKCRE